MDTSNFKEVFESPKVKTLTAQVAALELEVVRLRNALETFIAEHEECEDGDGWMAQMCSMEALHAADEAMATPFTPQELPELIEKVEKMTIERCAVAAYVHYADACKKQGINAMHFGKWLACGAIRALPTGQIKLEELL